MPAKKGSPPLPFLLQRTYGLANVIITPSAALSLLHRIVATSGLTHAGWDTGPVHAA